MNVDLFEIIFSLKTSQEDEHDSKNVFSEFMLLARASSNEEKMASSIIFSPNTSIILENPIWNLQNIIEMIKWRRALKLFIQINFSIII